MAHCFVPPLSLFQLGVCSYLFPKDRKMIVFTFNSSFCVEQDEPLQWLWLRPTGSLALGSEKTNKKWC